MENESLIIALTIVSIVSCVSLFVNWAGNRHIPGLLVLSIGFMATTFGVLMLTTQGSVTPIISVILANALILGGRIPIVMGLAAFWNQEQSKLPLICGALFLVTMGAISYFTLIDEQTVLSLRIYTFMMVVFSVTNIYIIANGLSIEKKLRPVTATSTNFGAFLALMLFSVNAVAEFFLMLVRSGAAQNAPDQGASFMSLGAIFTMVVFAVAVIIMTKEELSVEHKENSIYDPITTILNHRTFVEVGERIMGVALRYSQPVSLLTIEVENMDQIVRQHGYKVGNEILRHFSLTASDRRRSEDVLARSSFRQFRMLLPGVNEEGAKVVISKIKQALMAEDYVFRGKKLEVFLTISAVTRREEDLSLQEMLQEGEVELIRAKQETAVKAAPAIT